MSDTFEVRDHRNKAMFRVDDEYLNGYAKLCGTNATLTYLCLCRHADRHQESFPSVNLMAEKLGISRDSVMRGIKVLIEWNIIQKNRTRKPNAQWLNNTYILLDKSVWKNKPSSTQQHGKPSSKNSVAKSQIRASQVADSDTKGSHKKGSHIEGYAKTSLATSKEVKIDNIDQVIKKLEDDKRRSINIIALYIEHRRKSVEPKIKNLGQLQVFIKRHIRSATQLSNYSDTQIIDAFEETKRNCKDIDWTLETIIKTLSK